MPPARGWVVGKCEILRIYFSPPLCPEVQVLMPQTCPKSRLIQNLWIFVLVLNQDGTSLGGIKTCTSGRAFSHPPVLGRAPTKKNKISYSADMEFVVPEEILKDPKLAKWVKEHGFIDDKSWKRPKNPFHSLIHSIIYQQVSGKAAASILKKFKKLFGNKFPTPAQVLALPEEILRSAGLSGQKAKYIRDLADKFSDGTIVPRKFPRMTNDEIIEHLTRVKGIGVWTAHMFLLFTLKRPDILPTLDLAIRKGFQVIYGLKKMPEHAQMEKLARGWRKHASLASLYMWRASDGLKK